jgi:hypothetical protein
VLVLDGLSAWSDETHSIPAGTRTAAEAEAALVAIRADGTRVGASPYVGQHSPLFAELARRASC